MAADAQTILLAEDDGFLASLIKNRLSREGFEVVTVSNGAAVIETITKEKPALILLDIILPDRLGFDILRDLHESEELKDIPVMVISNLAQESDIKKAKDMGAKEYFVKAHIMIDDLVSSVVTTLKHGSS